MSVAILYILGFVLSFEAHKKILDKPKRKHVFWLSVSWPMFSIFLIAGLTYEWFKDEKEIR